MQIFKQINGTTKWPKPLGLPFLGSK